MSPPLPDRYDATVRLGRDDDVEEWLATDTALDRPVLVRYLPADAPPERHSAFIESVQRAAAVTHPHLAAVYAASRHDSGSYAIVEWTGGASIADRLAAGDTFPVDEFLPNAAGLASALSVLHATGAVHGAIDAGAIQFSASHPAKLGSFGRQARGRMDPVRDVADLAATLREAITGSTDGPPPSQVAEGLSRDVDVALEAAAGGSLDAAALSDALRGAPSPGPREDAGPVTSLRWLVTIGVLFLAALLIAAAGFAIEYDPDSPLLFPATPPRSTLATTTTTVVLDPPTTRAGSPVDVPDGTSLAYSVTVYDPFADGTERDGDLPLLSDDDPSTAWRTERYFDPVSRLKPGVGLVFRLTVPPARLEFDASPGTDFTIAWADEIGDDLSGWQQVAGGTTSVDTAEIPLPDRAGGVWLIWFTELPSQDDGEFFYAAVSEVRFLAR